MAEDLTPPTALRVQESTAEHVNRAIRRQTRLSLARYTHGEPQEINRRLRELDREWNTEKTLEANAAGFALAGLLLGAFVKRPFLLLPGVVAGFLLQHALQGWCPPVEVIRRLGVRTPREIDNERAALKALRGDFHGLGPGADPEELLARAEM